MPHPLDRQFCRPMAQQRFKVNNEDFELEGHLGDGAVGLVRKAKRLSDGARRAVKFLAPDSKYIDEAAFDDVATRFHREGERGARLDHPHLIKIYSYGENEDGSAFEDREPKNPFIVMEQVQGRTLENHIRKFRNTVKQFTISREALHIGIQVANALYELHRMKLIHRDVKPANVFIAKRAAEGLFPLVKLGDFGM